MTAIGSPKPVIGVSGGLDSTHALLVVARAMDRMDQPLALSSRTRCPGSRPERAHEVERDRAGRDDRRLDRDARHPSLATEMLERLGRRGEPVHDITFENVQAGLRTDYLFRLANHHGGAIIGTSDLSELALGWATHRRRRPHEPPR